MRYMWLFGMPFERNLCLAFGALFVDTHFSVSHDAVYVALWNAF